MRSLANVIQDQHFAADLEPELVKYMLFIKSPPSFDEKKVRQEKARIMHNVTDKEKQLRDHIQKLLQEAETLRGLEMTINDLNSLTEIMSIIRQHTEKKKAFTSADFMNKILQISIG